MAVEVAVQPSFSHGAPQRLFELPRLSRPVSRFYDVSADRQRFVVVESLEPDLDRPASIHITQNWYEEYRDREQD